MKPSEEEKVIRDFIAWFVKRKGIAVHSPQGNILRLEIKLGTNLEDNYYQDAVEAYINQKLGAGGATQQGGTDV